MLRFIRLLASCHVWLELERHDDFLCTHREKFAFNGNHGDRVLTAAGFTLEYPTVPHSAADVGSCC